MDNSKTINEIYWLRSLACLAVVVFHAVNATIANYETSLTQFEEYTLIAIRFMTFFGTPAFVFISELLLSYSYPDGVPKGFFVKRVKFLLIPFAFMGLVAAVVYTDTVEAFWDQLFLNLFFGGYTGYFVLIIFQFYILHVLAHRYLDNWRPSVVITVSFLISTGYLLFFHMSEPPQVMLADYIWERGHWLPVFPWLFYFTLGYYCGKHYDRVIETLLPFRKVLYLLPMLMLGVIFFFVRSDILTVVSSKRIDNILYTTAMIAVILITTYRMKHIPGVILLISKYSFNIYLLHTVILHYMPPFNGVNPLIYMVLVTPMSMVLSIWLVKLTSSFAVTPYLIGKTLKVPEWEKRVSQVKKEVTHH